LLIENRRSGCRDKLEASLISSCDPKFVIIDKVLWVIIAHVAIVDGDCVIRALNESTEKSVQSDRGLGSVARSTA